jgi:hypothetical protein
MVLLTHEMIAYKCNKAQSPFIYCQDPEEESIEFLFYFAARSIEVGKQELLV